MLLGAALLVAAVVEAGRATREVYLPDGAGWYDFWSGAHFAGGQAVTLPAPWDRPPLLVRDGGVLPVNLAERHFAAPADERGFLIFPPPGAGVATERFFEDDGETVAYRAGHHATWDIHVVGTAAELVVTVALEGEIAHPPDAVRLILPAGERRRIVVNDAEALPERLDDGRLQVVAAPRR
jgi:alpha-glucosidase